MKFSEKLFFKKIEETCFTTKVAFATQTFLSRSHFVVISSCSERHPSLQLFQKKFVFIISFFFLFTINFSQKSLSKIRLLKRKSPISFNCLLNFVCACCVFFFLFLFCFSVLSFFQFVQPKKFPLKKSFEKIWVL